MIDNQQHRIYYDTVAYDVKFCEKIYNVLKPFFNYGFMSYFRKQEGASKFAEFHQIPFSEVWQRMQSDMDLDGESPDFDMSYNSDVGKFFTRQYAKHVVRGVDEFTGEIIENDETVQKARKFLYDFTPDKVYTSDGVECVPSSCYTLNVSVRYRTSTIKQISYVTPYVHIEFSIPKFLFGHNLLLYPLNGDTDGKELGKFTRKFFKCLFGIDNLSEIGFEYSRIDVSISYKFDSLENYEMYRRCLIYHTSKVKLKRNIQIYGNNETFMYKTDGYSVKIYDKTAEFRKDDYKEIQKYYFEKYLPMLGEHQACRRADEIANFFKHYSENIWRCELTLRKEQMNYMFWQDWRSRSFLKKEKYVSAYNNFKNFETFMSGFGEFMNMPAFSAWDVDKENKQNDRFCAYLDKYYNDVFVTHSDRPFIIALERAKKLFSLRTKIFVNDRMEMYREFVNRQVIEDYRVCNKLMRRKKLIDDSMKVIVKKDSLDDDSREGSMYWDSLMVKRAFSVMENYVNSYKSVRATKKVTLSDYLKLHQERLTDTGLLVGKEWIKLSTRLLSALVKFDLLLGKNHSKQVIAKNKTYYRNIKILDALTESLNLTNSSLFVCPEVFDLRKPINEKMITGKNFYENVWKEQKFMYICPIINNMLSSYIIDFEVYKQFYNRI